MADRSDLTYPADRGRDHGREPESNLVTQTEEVAVAMHRVAEAIEAQNELLLEVLGDES